MKAHLKKLGLVTIWGMIAILLTSLPLSPALALDGQRSGVHKPFAQEPPPPQTEAQPPPGWQPGRSTRGIQTFNELTPVENPADWPYSAVTRLHITWPSGGTGTCSGVLIDPRHVLTAGHCVFDYNDPERGYEPCPKPTDPADEPESCWATAIEVVPAYDNGNAPFGKAHMLRPMSWTRWTEGEKDYAHDIGVIFLDRPIGALSGWYGYGASGDHDFFLEGRFHNSSYPGAPDRNGQEMWTRAGSFDTSGTYQAGHTNLSYFGQSGGGYAHEYDTEQDLWRVYAVTSNYHLESNQSTVTYCPKITYFDPENGKLVDIIEWIDGHTPTQPDLVPLNAEVTVSSIEAGQQTSLSFLLHNYSSVVWTGTLSIGVYLSTDDVISTTDELLYTDLYRGSIGAKSWIRRHVPDPLDIPSDKEGAYHVGVLLNIQDSDTANNVTIGWDTAQIDVTRVKLKTYLPYVVREPQPESPILISDDFSDPNSGWYEAETAEILLAYTDGEYRVQAKNQDSLAVATAPVQCANCSIEVNARFEGEPNKGYGLVFAKQGDDLYGFLAFPNSDTCDLVRFSADSAELLSREPCDLLLTSNHLRVDWQAPSIQTFVNGELIQDLTNDALEDVGDIGLITYFEGDARFDDFGAQSLLSTQWVGLSE